MSSPNSDSPVPIKFLLFPTFSLKHHNKRFMSRDWPPGLADLLTDSFGQSVRDAVLCLLSVVQLKKRLSSNIQQKFDIVIMIIIEFVAVLSFQAQRPVTRK